MTATKAVGYIRVSTDEQATSGVSLDMQKAKINQWAALRDAVLLDVFEDAGVSGTKADREGLARAMAMAKKHKATLVIYSLSRLSRSTKHTLQLFEDMEQAGCDLVSMSEQIDTTTAAGKMVFRMMAVLAEFERDQIAERTSAGLQQKKATGGKYTRQTPYGFEEVGNRFEQVAAEAAVVADIVDMKAKGMTYRGICEVLNSRGVPTKQGKQWQSATVFYLLKRSPIAKQAA